MFSKFVARSTSTSAQVREARQLARDMHLSNQEINLAGQMVRKEGYAPMEAVSAIIHANTMENAILHSISQKTVRQNDSLWGMRNSNR